MNKTALREDILRIKNLRESLLNVVYGQDTAVNAFSEAMFQHIVSARNTPKPGIFLFAGPPGVGKTFLAQKAGEYLKRPFISIDMSEYSHESDAAMFFGGDPGWKNAHAGIVTSFADKHPDAVILFDEIEKAHTNVMHLFLGLLQSGKAYDQFLGKNIDFSRTIMIFTTNVGRSIYENYDTVNISSLPREVILDAIQTEINPVTKQNYFPSALCSRFSGGCVVMFNHMSPEVLLKIVSSSFEKEAKDLVDSYDICISAESNVFSAFIYSEGGDSDARRITGRIGNFVKKEFYELVNLLSAKEAYDPGKLSRIKFTADYTTSPEEVVNLFDNKIKNVVVVLSECINPSSFFSKENNTELISVNTYEDAVNCLKKKNVTMVITDFCCMLEDRKYMCIDDFVSDGRRLFKFVKEMFSSIPVYVLETDSYKINSEEKQSLINKGAVGFITFDINDPMKFIKEIFVKNDKSYIVSAMHELSRSNKRLTFETSQEISADGTSVDIRLYDFRLITAVSGSDHNNIVDDVSCPSVKFSDVIGADDAKEELKYFLKYLRAPKEYLELGVRRPRGVLLYGPPGTGKTMLAKAMAGEAGVSFISTDGASLKNKYVGESGNNVRELFRKARKYAPTIIFIDEVDAVAMDRKDSSNTTANTEALNALLTEMDGFKVNADKPVFVLAATNMNIGETGEQSSKNIDPAFARRFDRKIFVDLPNRSDREKYLRMKNNSEKLLDLSEEEIMSISERSAGMSLAELENIIELSFRNAIRQEIKSVNDEIFDDSFSNYHDGNAKKWSKESLERTARHEAGHAVVSCHLGKIPAYITIISRGEYGGYVQLPEEDDIPTYSKDMLLDRIKVMLGGMAAEMYFYGQYNTGISSDLSKASALAEQMICTYGMYPGSEVGMAPVKSGSDNAQICEKVRKLVNSILLEQLEMTGAVIEQNIGKVNILVEMLMEKNHLRKNELAEFWNKE